MKVAAIDTAAAYSRRQEEYIHLKLDIKCKFKTIFHARFLATPQAVQLFRLIAPGDTVTVSGYVLGSSDPKSLERSLTERGSIERPEYDMHLTNPHTVEIPPL